MLGEVGETLVQSVAQFLAQSENAPAERAWSSQDHFYRQRFLISESHRFMMRRCAFSSSSLSPCLGLYTSTGQHSPVKTKHERKLEKYFVRLSLDWPNTQSAEWDSTGKLSANQPILADTWLLSLPRLSRVSSREYFVNKTKKTVRLQIRFL